MKIAIVGAGFTAGRGRPAAPRHGDLQAQRRHPPVPRQVHRRHGRERLRPRLRDALLQPDRRASATYGFPESHAASFALLVYVSAWIKCFYPEVFACALLNSQPMGFYAPAQIVRDAREHGVEVRPVDVNHSYWDCTLEKRTPLPRTPARRRGRPCRSRRPERRRRCALRLGFRQVKGLPEAELKQLVESRATGHSVSVARALASHRARRARRSRRSPRPTPSARSASTAARRSGRSSGCARTRRCRSSAACRRRRDGARRRAAGDEPRRAGGRGLRAVGLSLKRHPLALLRRQLDRSPRPPPCAPANRRRRSRGQGRRPRAGAPAAGHGQRRHLHDARGRDRHRQSRRLAPRLRALPPHRHGRVLVRARAGCSARARSSTSSPSA